MRIRKEEENRMHQNIRIGRKSKIKYRLAALLMTVCLVLLTACGGNGGSAPEGSSGESSVEALGDVNPIPEDGIITKEQFETVAGENREIQFTGESDGISYVWTFNASQIQNPEDQNLKVTFTTEGLDDIKTAANNANDALKMTMEGQGLICVPTLTVTLPESWQSDTGLLLKEQNGSLATMSDVTIDSQPQEAEDDNAVDAANGNAEESTDEAGTEVAADNNAATAAGTAPVAGTTTLTMTVTSLDGDCYIVGGITGAQNKGADAANSASGGSTTAGGETGAAGSSAAGSTASGSGSGTDNESGNGSASGGNSGSDASAQNDSSSGSNSSGSDSSGSGDIKNDDVANDTSTLTCTISISCSTILNNMDNLTKGKEEFVPSDGWILPATTVEFSEGDSVHDVLQAVCKANGIHMESTYTPMYDSAYVEGINQLYEFDCGELSGWMYNVNGWFPNYGCSKYTVSDGDVINWVYTCDLGKDVGDNSMY